MLTSLLVSEPMNRSVAVIIPVRNGAQTVAQAVNSVLSQTHPATEIIVIDDNSSDSTLEILGKFGSKIKVLKGFGLGAGPARNVGIEAATSEYVAFLDADDIWIPEKLESQLPYLDEGVVVGAYAKYVSGPKFKRVGSSIRTVDNKEANLMLRRREGMPALLSTWVLKKSDIEKYGLFDPMYLVAQDYEFLMRHVSAGLKMVVIRKELVRYLIHISSETASTYVQQYLTAHYVKKDIQGTLGLDLDTWLDQAEKQKIMKSARAGYHFRKALVATGSARTYHQVLVNAAISAFLNPKDFIWKFRRQGPSFRSSAK